MAPDALLKQKLIDTCRDCTPVECSPLARWPLLAGNSNSDFSRSEAASENAPPLLEGERSGFLESRRGAHQTAHGVTEGQYTIEGQ